MSKLKSLRYGTIAAVILTGLGAGIASAVTPSSGAGTISDYTAVATARVLDTRTTLGGHDAAVGSDAAVTFTIPNLPAGATAVTLNVTETAATGGGFIVAYPAGTTRPTQGSNLNFSAGQTLANEVTVPLGADDQVSLYNSSGGTVQLVVDEEGYYTPTAAAYTPPVTSWTATSTVADHPDSADSDNGGTWAVDTISRTASITLKGAASVGHCGSGAISCYLYEGSISDTGSFTTASSADVTTDGESPNAGTAINGTVTGTLIGGSAIQFYASSDAPSADSVPAMVSGAVSGEQTTTGWVEQFFAAGTSFGSGPTLLNWDWTYSAPNTCEQWVDALSGETGDIAGVNACAS